MKEILYAFFSVVIEMYISYCEGKKKGGEESMMHERLHKGDDHAEPSRRTITLWKEYSRQRK